MSEEFKQVVAEQLRLHATMLKDKDDKLIMAALFFTSKGVAITLLPDTPPHMIPEAIRQLNLQFHAERILVVSECWMTREGEANLSIPPSKNENRKEAITAYGVDRYLGTCVGHYIFDRDAEGRPVFVEDEAHFSVFVPDSPSAGRMVFTPEFLWPEYETRRMN